MLHEERDHCNKKIEASYMHIDTHQSTPRVTAGSRAHQEASTGHSWPLESLQRDQSHEDSRFLERGDVSEHSLPVRPKVDSA